MDAHNSVEQDLVRLRQTSRQLSERSAAPSQRLATLRRPNRPPGALDAEYAASFAALDRRALAVTARAGTFGFFLLVLAWSVAWLGWNLLAPRALRFDPAPAFALWLFISHMGSLPLLMVGQNLLSRHGERNAESDREINQQAERQVEAILRRLERQEELAPEILHRLAPWPARNGSSNPWSEAPMFEGTSSGRSTATRRPPLFALGVSPWTWAGKNC